ncbi:HLH-domain-containing protein [Hesseltinella vesiculosa]|uniref:HLH-domain-containing protein n=1 Tax=Hesseltinella vesiculosa TaxID=101127 RepID=A0A1X2GEN9_9FUNG|nr:HLH-domain-containing protein [Hesseltinella vesiculosa]
MYNVPFQVHNYASTPDNTNTPTNHDLANNERLYNTSNPGATAPIGAIDPSLTNQLLNDPDLGKKDRSYNYIPLNAASPIPSTKPIHPTDTSSPDKPQHHRSSSLNYDMYSPSPTFKRPSTSSSVDRKDDPQLYYSTNDQWTLSPSSSTIDRPGQTDSVESVAVLDDDPQQQQHMQQLFEKKRRRRESHNAVERRRRDNINERIYELSTLLPERDAIKNNKGTILRKSVEHIQRLQDELTQNRQRIHELEQIVNLYRMRVGDLGMDLQQQRPPAQPTPSHAASATTMMGYNSLPQIPFRRDG